jgi:hypothetical protein
MASRFVLLLICASAVPGCKSLLTATTADVAGIAGAGIAGAVTESPAAAAGIGLGIAAAANAGLQSIERDVHRTTQDQIAQAAGALDPGVVGHWSASHTIPIESDEHGDLVVTRLFGNADFACKEIIFSVDTMEKKTADKTAADPKPVEQTIAHRAFYTAIICKDGTTWKWASAEPATARWGSLQ